MAIFLDSFGKLVA